ncbi:homeobox and leucine zipper encoding a [Lampris incognitus]|uniref:homeobox and leucine zipper encoding a n=1 Tax=Lampris incognitus TaxID=2546036 RepID=UPI0024B6099D|nr:homeobox and leucine zipper encoding a [Lampris incognitus]XP_056149564.1 homeobox and leucine zipper encoding a [Lampris incognitus]XP_056149565.1 homeobox and leucine zipper encoding a [Lampris incognitus]
MAAYSECNGRTGLDVEVKKPPEGEGRKIECEDKHAIHSTAKDVHQPISGSDGNTGSGASFSTNNNSVVCLPLVSEGLKLVWTQADQTRELDTIPELVQAFNLFPYPTSREVNALARVCGLPLDKVKVWFMVQRIKYGISWASEEIEETRRKLSVPELCGNYTETKEETKIKTKRKSGEEVIMKDKDNDRIEGSFSTLVSSKKKPTTESPESYRPARPAVPCFSSSLPPPQDSYYYRPPADMPATIATDVSVVPSDLQQRRHGRYKKSKAQLAVLRSSFLRENWPAEAELRRLQEETGLSRNDIRKWFSDSRYQLRVGRGAFGATQVYPSSTVATLNDDPQQIQPLSLVAQKVRQHQNGVKVHEGPRSSGIKDSHFFQTFLSNSLEAFGDRVAEAEGCEGVLDISGENGHRVKDEEQSEEKPLQLTKDSKIDPDILQQPLSLPKPSPCSSSSGTPPPPTTSLSKRHSNGISSMKKSASSAKASSSQTVVHFSGASSSTPTVLTPAGRPRKTKEQLDVLKQHFVRCQWPKSEDYTELVKLTGLPRADVIQWFGDTRYAVKNGQLRWVQGVCKQFLADPSMQQSNGGETNGSGSSTTPQGGGSRKRKSRSSGASTCLDSPNIQPLEAYHRLTGILNEKDLDSLCKKSRMSYQQVRDWFASQETGVLDQEPNIID